MQKYFFPIEQKTIEAESIEEAKKILFGNSEEYVSKDKKPVSSKQKRV